MYKTLIDCQTLTSVLDEPSTVVVDCRFDLSDTQAGKRAYVEGHIPKAVYAHLDRDLSGPKSATGGRHPLPSPAMLCHLFSRLGIDAGKQVIAYDAAGGMLAAARFWWLLRYMGHDAAAVLDGGWSAWVAGGGAVEAGSARARPAQFHGEPRRERVMTVAGVSEAACLIDSRDPARYRGEVEPIDPVAGHIPGARNHFCKANLDNAGRFLPAAELARQFGAFGEAMRAGRAAFYCGSGVTACHNILAAVHAGFPEPQLYAGSWSEWCRDPQRPIARGEQPVSI